MFYRQHLKKLEIRLQPFLHDDFFFVNVGANDGVLNDPIYPFILKYGWHGIAVEPVPHVFAQLSANYRNLQGVVLEQVAVAESPRPFWYVKPGSGSAEFSVQQIGSLKKDVVYDTLRRLRGVNNPGPLYFDVAPEAFRDVDQTGPLVVNGVEAYVQRLDVECVTFNELMERHRVDHIDFLNIDVEGCDLEILRSVDFDRFAPEVLCIEVNALPDADAEELAQLLRLHDYVFMQYLGIHSHIYTHAK